MNPGSGAKTVARRATSGGRSSWMIRGTPRSGTKRVARRATSGIDHPEFIRALKARAEVFARLPTRHHVWTLVDQTFHVWGLVIMDDSRYAAERRSRG